MTFKFMWHISEWERTIRQFVFAKKQIDVSLYSVCPVIDNECHIKHCQSRLLPRGSTATMLWRNSWSITGQTHKQLTSICYINYAWVTCLLSFWILKISHSKHIVPRLSLSLAQIKNTDPHKKHVFSRIIPPNYPALCITHQLLIATSDHRRSLSKFFSYRPLIWFCPGGNVCSVKEENKSDINSNCKETQGRHLSLYLDRYQSPYRWFTGPRACKTFFVDRLWRENLEVFHISEWQVVCPQDEGNTSWLFIKIEIWILHGQFTIMHLTALYFLTLIICVFQP